MPGLYVHIPFCVKKCHYCNFVIALTGQGDRETKFLDLFKKEVLHYAPELKNRVFDTLYLGGGTPSVLSQDQLGDIFSFLRSHFHFKKNAEVTLEANPDDINPSKANFFKKIGVGRVSLGAQSFHDKTLKKMNRAHKAAQIDEAFGNLREAKMASINLDLMLSLPEETMEDLEFSLEELRRLDPDHVSLYELVVEEKTVFKILSEQGKLKLPEEDLQVQMLVAARAFLKKQGWRQYELLNYSKPGHESKHNQIYWKNEEYLGLGPGAFSYLNGKRFQLSESFKQYTQKVSQEDWSPSQAEVLTPEKKEIESFLLALRTVEGVDTIRFKKLIKKSALLIQDLCQNNLLRQKEGKIQLTDQGQLFAETIFSEFSSSDS